MLTGAVIVTYNPQISGLESLIQNIEHSVTNITIVDNGSGNVDEITTLAAKFSKTFILLLSENKGIGFAQNRGIEKVFADTNVDAVILFDHDSHPSSNMIVKLISCYNSLTEQNIGVGAVGPVFIDPRTQNQYPIPVYRGFRLKHILPHKDDMTPVFTSFLIASGTLIPRQTIGLVGMMNEDFFIDYIDIEWSFRVYNKGMELYTCPAAKMFHQVGDERLTIFGREISVHSPLRRYYLARNAILITRLSYINWKYKVREIIYTFSRVLVYLCLVNHKLTYIRYIAKGWRDGIMGRTGPYNPNN